MGTRRRKRQGGRWRDAAVRTRVDWKGNVSSGRAWLKAVHSLLAEVFPAHPRDLRRALGQPQPAAKAPSRAKSPTQILPVHWQVSLLMQRSQVWTDSVRSA